MRKLAKNNWKYHEFVNKLTNKWKNIIYLLRYIKMGDGSLKTEDGSLKSEDGRQKMEMGEERQKVG